MPQSNGSISGSSRSTTILQHQQRQFPPMPQWMETYSATSSSPCSPDNKTTSKRKPSPIHDLVGYMADLPSLSEVKAACDCYTDECGDLGTSLQLCYVSQSQLNELWLQLCSMQMSRLQLAFLYAVLANVGISTPAGHRQYSLEGLLSSQLQEKCILHSIDLLNEIDNEAGQIEAEANNQVDSYMRCHLLLLITFYQQSAAQYQQAWNSCKNAIQEAHKCRLFYIQDWIQRETSSAIDIHTIQILQGEIYFLFNWMASTVGSLDPIPFQPNFPTIVIPPVQSDDPIDLAFMRQKMQCCTIARNCAKKTTTSILDSLNRHESLKMAISLDDEILDYWKSQHQCIQDVAQYSNIDSNDRNAVSLATYAFLSKGGMMLQRWRLAQSFYERHSLDIFQHIALSSARTTLQMLPIVERCFNSPWQTITVRSWADGNYNQALFVFLSAIKSHLYQDNQFQATKVGGDRYKQAICGELTWFMTNFNRLYESMNKLGMVRNVLAQCAAALRETPVEVRFQHHQHSYPQQQQQQSSAASSNTSSSSSPSSSPIDHPIFQLSTQDCDYEHKFKQYEDVESVLRHQYLDHSVFKLAVEAHSRSNISHYF